MFGFQPLLAIVSHMFFIGVSFYALQALMPEKIITKKSCVSSTNFIYFFKYYDWIFRIKFLS